MPGLEDIAQQIADEDAARSRPKPQARVQVRTLSPLEQVAQHIADEDAGPVRTDRARIANPDVAGAFRRFSGDLQKQGITARLNSGDRSVREQQGLYANRGANPYPVARPGASPHNRGTAADMAFFDAKGTRVDPATVADLAHQHGFRWMGARDRVHFDYVGAPTAPTPNTQRRTPAAPVISIRPSVAQIQSGLAQIQARDAAPHPAGPTLPLHPQNSRTTGVVPPVSLPPRVPYRTQQPGDLPAEPRHVTLAPPPPTHPMNRPLLTLPSGKDVTGKDIADFALGSVAPTLHHVLSRGPLPGHSQDQTDMEAAAAAISDFALLRGAGLVSKLAEGRFALTKAGKAWAAGMKAAPAAKQTLMRIFSPGGLLGAGAAGLGYGVALEAPQNKPLGQKALGVAQTAGGQMALHVGFGALGELLRGGRPVPTVEIARATGQEPQAVVQQMTELEKQRQVERTPQGWKRIQATPTPSVITRPPVVKQSFTAHEQNLAAEEALRHQSLAEPPPGATAPRPAPPEEVLPGAKPAGKKAAKQKPLTPVEMQATEEITAHLKDPAARDSSGFVVLPEHWPVKLSGSGGRGSVSSRTIAERIGAERVGNAWRLPDDPAGIRKAGDTLLSEQHAARARGETWRYPAPEAVSKRFGLSPEDGKSALDHLANGEYSQQPPTAPAAPAPAVAAPEAPARPTGLTVRPAAIPEPTPAPPAEHHAQYMPHEPAGTSEGGRFNGPPEYPPDHPKATGLANVVQEAEVKRGDILRDPEKGITFGDEESQRLGHQEAQSQPDPLGYAEALAKRLATEDVKVTGKRVGVLAEGKRLFQKAINDATTDAERNTWLERQQAYLDNVQKAVHTEWHNVGVALQGGSTLEHGDYASVLSAYREKKGSAVTPAEAAPLRKGSRQVSLLEEENANLQKALADEREQHAATVAEAAQAAMKRAKSEAPTTATTRSQTARQGRLKQLKSEEAGILADMARIAKEGMSHLPSGPVAAYDAGRYAYAAGRLTLNRIRQGSPTLDKAIEDVIEHFKKIGVAISRSEIINDIGELTQQGKGTRTRSTAQNLAAEARQEADLQKKIENLRAGIPNASPAGKRGRTGRIAELAKELEALRHSSEGRDLAEQQRVRNRIAILRSGQPTPPRQAGPAPSPELAALRAERDRLNKERLKAAAAQARPQGMQPGKLITSRQKTLDKLNGRIAALKSGAPPRERLYKTKDAEIDALTKERNRLETEARNQGVEPGRTINRYQKQQEAQAGAQPGQLINQKIKARAAAEQKAKDTLAELDRKLRANDLTPLPKKARTSLTDAQEHLRALLRIRTRELNARIEAAAPKSAGQRIGGAIQGVADTIRGTTLGSDIGVLTRQGLFAWSRPATALTGVGRGLKASLSDVNLARLENEIEGRQVNGKSALLARRKAGLSMPDDVNGHEELIAGRLLKKLPIVGKYAGGLERFQKAFLMSVRADLFDNALRSGFSEAELRTRAEFINSSTGRGNITRVPSLLRVIMTSPRYEASRWEMLAAPLKNLGSLRAEGKLNRAAVANLQDMAVTALGVVGLFKAAELAGYRVDWNPISTNFLQMRKGDDVWDVSAGIAPRLRDAVRLYVYTFHPTYRKNAATVLQDTWKRTLTPGIRVPASFAANEAQKIQGVPQPIDPFSGYSEDERQGWITLLPIIWQSAEQAQRAEGPGSAAWAGAREFIGGGVNRYPAKRQPAPQFNPFARMRGIE